MIWRKYLDDKLYMTLKNMGVPDCVFERWEGYQALFLYVASNDALYLPNRQPKYT